MRRAAKIDDNQPEIVKALEKAGCTVQTLGQVGNGCPDLLVGRGGVNYLLEVKDGDKIPSRRKLNPDQMEWHECWNGQVTIVETVDEALRKVGL